MSDANRAPRILVYGFRPYLGFRENVTEKIVTSLAPAPGLVARVFDVLFDRGMLREALLEARPRWVLGLGQHPRARKLRIERRAVNSMSAGPGDPPQPITPHGPPIRRATWRLEADEGSTVTYDAGRFVCNFSMYIVGEVCEELGARFAFVHVPARIDPGGGLRHVEAYIRAAGEVSDRSPPGVSTRSSFTARSGRVVPRAVSGSTPPPRPSTPPGR